MKHTVALIAATIGFSGISIAQSERDLDSHEHGSAALNIALDGDHSVFIELESPWNNIVGFEHAPSTDDQHKLVDDAMALLNKPGSLFAFAGTTCSVEENTIESSLAAEDHGEHDDEHKDDHADDHDDHDDEHKDAHGDDDEHKDDHAEDHDDHDDEHKDAHGDEHSHDDHDDEHKDAHDDEHDHDEHAAGEDTHSAVLVTTEFHCDDISKLESIDVTLLSVWSGFEDLDVQLIGPGGQAGLELSPSQSRVDVKQVQ